MPVVPVNIQKKSWNRQGNNSVVAKQDDLELPDILLFVSQNQQCSGNPAQEIK
jgi:hypothetical protein